MNCTALFPQGIFEIALPYRITVKNKKEALELINRYNGIKRVFYSLYHIDHNPDRINPILDKIWFDFDSDKAHENTIKMHEWCKEKDIKHCMVFSGGGFHFYIFTDKIKVDNSKATLLQIHKNIMQELNFNYGDNNCDVDGHIVGDIARSATLPGTFNVKRQRYAISLTEEEVYKELNEIKELAGKQRNEIYVYCSKPYTLTPFQHIKNIYEHCEMPETKTIKFNCDEDIQKFPPCIQAILINENDEGDWKGRWIATTFMHEYGLTDEQINEIAEKYFGNAPRTDRFKNNYNHWKQVKVLNYAKTNVFPKCELMHTMGRCQGKCKWYR